MFKDTVRWTEPVILLLIMINTVILIIQSSRSSTLPTSDGTNDTPSPPQVKGYFHSWEDYALFALFITFTYVLALPILYHTPHVPLLCNQPGGLCSYQCIRTLARPGGSCVFTFYLTICVFPRHAPQYLCHVCRQPQLLTPFKANYQITESIFKRSFDSPTSS